eukprot:scaffold126616_cov75-Phaeocystis_antarctica.AAC.2
MHTPHKPSYFTLYTWHAPRGSAAPPGQTWRALDVIIPRVLVGLPFLLLDELVDAHHGGVIRHVPGDDRGGADGAAVPHGDVAQYSGARAWL